MLKERTLTSLVFAPLVLAVFYFGGWYFLLFMALVAFLAAVEYRKLLGLAGVTLDPLFAAVCTAVVLAACLKGSLGLILALALGALIVLSMSLRLRSVPSAMFALSGMMYIGGLLGCLGLLRNGEGGRTWALTVLLATWATDVGAYFGGMAFGRRKIAPAISPGKSWEGAISGIALAIVAGGVAAKHSGISLWFGVAGGLILSVLAELGDLVESLLKRWAHVKDSGSFLPGHGGVLDRFDSLLFTGAGGLILRVLYALINSS
ncbi:MAG TPA: phosphatidate cytidylyltransferase [Firmicutes bacterium]|nr:phosphatidate cytidylyltransferase [Candidatus Fermentithermobacillaceae bacterium]